jgi:hypothetical protein
LLAERLEKVDELIHPIWLDEFMQYLNNILSY